MYRSTVDMVGNAIAGLAGPLVIARPGGLAADGRKAADVDKEFFMFMQVGPHIDNGLQKLSGFWSCIDRHVTKQNKGFGMSLITRPLAECRIRCRTMSAGELLILVITKVAVD